MKRTAIFFFSFIAYYSFAQQTKVDSLKKLVLAAKQDSGRVNALNTLAWEIKGSAPDSSIYFGEQALQLSEKINFFSGKTNALACIGNAYYSKGDYLKGLDYLLKAKSLEEQLE